jgi:hypothetical protein
MQQSRVDGPAQQKHPRIIIEPHIMVPVNVIMRTDWSSGSIELCASVRMNGIQTNIRMPPTSHSAYVAKQLIYLGTAI